MLPSEYYYQQCHSLNKCYDEQQSIIMLRFDKLFLTLTRPAWFAWAQAPVFGLYLWGSVGAGKTFLMDCFFNVLPIHKKRRYHFHAFMEQVHQLLNQHLGRKNPLNYIAREIAKTTRVLCLDEFFVKHIADAMVLSGLLKALFDQKICLVVTSNSSPDLLYQHGLQRQNFLSAIALLKQKLTIVALNTTQDYRTLYLKKNGYYYWPLDVASEQAMKAVFGLYAHDGVTTEPLCLLGRSIPVLARSAEAVWFDFTVICGIPRAQQDYLALVRLYHVILISYVPVITDRNDATNFIHLVDILYDAGVVLILSAEKPCLELYSEGELVLEFKRTASRLLEMQSDDYSRFEKR